MTFPANLKLNLWMNIRFDVHSHPNLKRKHISLNLKTINEDMKPAKPLYFDDLTWSGMIHRG